MNNKFVFALAVGLGLLILAAPGQGEWLYSADSIRGQVVDEKTGRPLAGVVVVARWNTVFHHSNLHESGWYDDPSPLHIAEAVTDEQGWYEIPAWGPKWKLTGHVSDFDDPRLLVFKHGYMPSVFRNDGNGFTGWTAGYTELIGRGKHNTERKRTSRWNGQALKLRQASANCSEYVQTLQEFQQKSSELQATANGLFWDSNTEDWRLTPHMAEALIEEKTWLGKDGAQLRVGEWLFGNSGKGKVLGPSGEIRQYVILGIHWPIRPDTDAPAPGSDDRYFFDTGGARPESFTLSAWVYPGPALPAGWKLDRLKPIKVDIYDSEAQYEHATGLIWPSNGKVVTLRERSHAQDAKENELKQWRSVLDLALEKSRNPATAPFNQPPLALLRAFQKLCKQLPEESRAGLCYEESEQELRLLKSTEDKSFTYPNTPPQRADCEF